MSTPQPITAKWRHASPGARLNINMGAGEARPWILSPDSSSDTLSGVTDVVLEIYRTAAAGPIVRKSNDDDDNPIELNTLTGDITVPWVKSDTFTFSGRLEVVVWDNTAGNEHIIARGWASFDANPDAAGDVPSNVPIIVSWSQVTGTPTTLAGYGITDGLTLDPFLQKLVDLGPPAENSTLGYDVIADDWRWYSIGGSLVLLEDGGSLLLEGGGSLLLES